MPAGPEALRIGAEAVQARLIRIHEQGGLFRLSVQRMFEKVCDRFDMRGVQILAPSSASKEFLLGDVPAITLDRSTGAAGVRGGIAVDQADEIIMPLAPRLLVVLGHTTECRSIPDAEVDQYNALGGPDSRGLCRLPAWSSFRIQHSAVANVRR